jgi:hypothetical protein
VNTTEIGRREALEQAVQQYLSGANRYGASHLGEAIAAFDRATRLAAAAGSRKVEERSRFWQGAALHGAGRMPEAFAVWAPALTAAHGGLSADRYMTLTRYVLAAVEMPLPLELLERTLTEVEGHVNTLSGGAGPRSRLLLARSRLALARGRPRESLAIGLEALTRRKQEAVTYSYSTHFRTLVRAALSAQEPDTAAALLDEWDLLEREYPNSKRFALTAGRSNLAQSLGNNAEALRLAATVAEEALRSDDVVYSVDASVAFVNASLAAGKPQGARRTVAHLLRLRRSAFGEIRFEVRLLLGDYHAAVAALEGKRSPGERVERAHRAYRAAEREGARLDGLLGTKHRAEVLALRRSRLRELVQRR